MHKFMPLTGRAGAARHIHMICMHADRGGDGWRCDPQAGVGQSDSADSSSDGGWMYYMIVCTTVNHCTVASWIGSQTLQCACPPIRIPPPPACRPFSSAHRPGTRRGCAAPRASLAGNGCTAALPSACLAATYRGEHTATRSQRQKLRCAVLHSQRRELCCAAWLVARKQPPAWLVAGKQPPAGLVARVQQRCLLLGPHLLEVLPL